MWVRENICVHTARSSRNHNSLLFPLHFSPLTLDCIFSALGGRFVRLNPNAPKHLSERKRQEKSLHSGILFLSAHRTFLSRFFTSPVPVLLLPRCSFLPLLPATVRCSQKLRQFFPDQPFKLISCLPVRLNAMTERVPHRAGDQLSGK